MIASLTGRLTSKTPTHALVDVQGVGYELFIPTSTYYALPALDEPVHVCVHTHLRDDALQLYGFATPGEKQAFLLLTTVTGIGPKMALGVLSALPLADLRAAIRAEDVEKLATVPGVGKKSASRMVLELKDKIDRLEMDPATLAVQPARPTSATYDDALSALLNLGYRPADAKAVLGRVPTDRAALKDVIRTALQELAKG
ncbi:MAG: Holliday junction branch migration protein RuvA [Nitrospiraceae bacterium]